MNTSPLVSINMRTLNSEKTLAQTLQSIKNQTYDNVEIVITDGYSKDRSVEIASKYNAKVHYADKLGDARYLNYRKSRGKYILSVDSDQILDSRLVEECVKICEVRGVDALIISEKSIIQNNTILERIIAYDKWVIDSNKDLDVIFGAACPRFFRKNLLSKIRWPKKLAMFDDTILYSELLKKGAKVGYISNQSIRHHEVSSWAIFIKKFYRYGKGYFRSLQVEPSTVVAHSLPRRSYFSKTAFSKPHYFLGLLLLYFVKVVAALCGTLSYIVESLFRRFFDFIWHEAMTQNIENILSLLEKNPFAKIVDVGCGDGQVTIRYKERIGGKITGIDGVEKRLNAALKKGVDQVIAVELENKWPLKNSSFDVAISNQVIEHVLDIDHFIKEIYRILKPGGYCVISTENLSSWHNVFSLILGFQDFSHHILKKRHISNPLSPHYGEKTCTWSAKDHSGVDDTAYPHIKILTYRSLINALLEYEFEFVSGKGSGYYPLFAFIGGLMAKIDPYHSHFITIKVRKPFLKQ